MSNNNTSSGLGIAVTSVTTSERQIVMVDGAVLGRFHHDRISHRRMNLIRPPRVSFSDLLNAVEEATGKVVKGSVAVITDSSDTPDVPSEKHSRFVKQVAESFSVVIEVPKHNRFSMTSYGVQKPHTARMALELGKCDDPVTVVSNDPELAEAIKARNEMGLETSMAFVAGGTDPVVVDFIRSLGINFVELVSESVLMSSQQR